MSTERKRTDFKNAFRILTLKDGMWALDPMDPYYWMEQRTLRDEKDKEVRDFLLSSIKTSLARNVHLIFTTPTHQTILRNILQPQPKKMFSVEFKAWDEYVVFTQKEFMKYILAKKPKRRICAMNQQRKTITTCPYCHKSLQTRTAINNDIQIDPSKIPYSSIGHRRDVGAGIRRCNHCKEYYVFTYENSYNLSGGYPQCFSWYLESEATLTKEVCQTVLREMKEQGKNIPKSVLSIEYQGEG